jgi:uncharacterized metal-binding protein
VKNNDVCEPAEILIFPCSGGTNVGKIANEAAMDLTALHKGRMHCLAGIEGHVDSIIESTKMAKKLVVIDGCHVQCAKKTLEHAGFGVDVHVVVTGLGIKKIYDFMMDLDDVNRVVDSVSRQIRGNNPRKEMIGMG